MSIFIDDRTVARLRWCSGIITGACMSLALANGQAGVEAHPVRSAILGIIGLGMLAFDWVVLDEDDDDGPY